MGAVFLWFGVLKFFPAVSPAEGVAVRTATKLTFGLLPPDVVLRVLAVAETAIGCGLVTGVLLRVALVGFFAHMAGVFSALLLLSGEMWQRDAPVPTMEGQYIIKNVVLVAACLVVAADEWGRAAPRRGSGPTGARSRHGGADGTPHEPPRSRGAGTRTPSARPPANSPAAVPSSGPAHRSPHRDEVS